MRIIVKKIEVGNVSLPLNGSLITGSQSLFGFVKTCNLGEQLLPGDFYLSTKKFNVKIEVSGGAQTSEFDIYADQYI